MRSHNQLASHLSGQRLSQLTHLGWVQKRFRFVDKRNISISHYGFEEYSCITFHTVSLFMQGRVRAHRCNVCVSNAIYYFPKFRELTNVYR